VTTTDVRYRPVTQRDALIASEVVATAIATYTEFAGPDWRPRDAIQDEAELHDKLGRGNVHARLAFADGAAVALAGWQQARTETEPREPIPGRAHVWSLFVVPAWWGTGIAAELLEWIVTGMADSGFETAQLWTARDNARARRFYEREGWTTNGTNKFSPELNLDLVFYEKALR
jgi:GNAT superfamily N-acetyltransferase